MKVHSSFKLTEVPKMSVCAEEEEGRVKSPVPSGLSVKSDWSRSNPPNFSNESELLDEK